MLRAILAIMTPAAGAVCVEDLAARLDVSPSALEGLSLIHISEPTRPY